MDLREPRTRREHSVGECFFEGEVPAEVVLDMVYNPTVIPGLEMFHRVGGETVRDPDE
jgi:hypothetical protein